MLRNHVINAKCFMVVRLCKAKMRPKVRASCCSRSSTKELTSGHDACHKHDKLEGCHFEARSALAQGGQWVLVSEKVAADRIGAQKLPDHGGK